MDRIAMLNGLSGKDFSLGTILATAATGAAVHGLMYPMTEVAYGLSDNFIKNVTPSNWRKPLPQGYKPQTVKIDKLNFQDKDKDWDKHRKIMDQLDGDQLRGYTMTLDPKFSNDTYSYLVGRGINPAKDENNPYLPAFRNTKLDFSDEELDKYNNLGGAAGVAALVGAGTLAVSPVNKEEDRSKNRRRALRNALIGGGLYYLAKNSKSGDGSEDLATQFGLDCQPQDLSKSYIPTDQECESWMKFLREVKYSKDKSVSDRLIESNKDMSMLNGLFI